MQFNESFFCSFMDYKATLNRDLNPLEIDWIKF